MTDEEFALRCLEVGWRPAWGEEMEAQDPWAVIRARCEQATFLRRWGFLVNILNRLTKP